VLRHAAARADTEDDVRRGLVTTLKVGLLRYLIETTAAERLGVSVSSPGAAGAVTRAPDRWNSWVVSVRSSAGIEAEESTRDVDLRGAIGADRVTPDWKITFASSSDYSAESFDLEEDEEEGEGTLLSIRRERLLRALVGRSLNDHWSIGARGQVRSSTFRNTAAEVSVAPVVEYNLFPYSDYTRRQLRFQYSVGTTRIRYMEETIFERTEETLAEQELSVTLDQRQPWGTLRTRAEISHYLHDASKHRLQVFGDLSLRVARGLSLTLSGSGSRVRDQLSLPRRGATAEEVLLRQRQLRSNFAYRFAAGFTYSFGSIYNTVVNPRFGQ